MYTITAAWIDTVGRTRTWALLDKNGRKIAEITTKKAAQALAARLNALEGKTLLISEGSINHCTAAW